MGLFDIFFKKKTTDQEAERRARLRQNGRITDGRIIDSDYSENGELIKVYYWYNISGADYESSQTMTDEQRQTSGKYAPGASVSVKYDPRAPGNSIVV
jgi:hypothetical protein